MTIPEQLHALIPAMLASFARRRGLPPGMLTSAVLQFEPILVIIGEHQRRQRSRSSAVLEAIISDYDAEFMVGLSRPVGCKHAHRVASIHLLILVHHVAHAGAYA